MNVSTGVGGNTFVTFLSSNTQDFIEVRLGNLRHHPLEEFLSSNTQDFIEVCRRYGSRAPRKTFLSSNTQDFIEVAQQLNQAIQTNASDS